MEFSVIIPTKNRFDDLKRTLEGLRDQTEKDFELIVVDNGCTDGSADLARGFGAKVVTFEKESGPGWFNFGWRNSKGDIVIFLNDDVEVPSNWFSSYKEIFTKDETLLSSAIVGGPAILPKEKVGNQIMIRFFVKSKENGFLHLLFNLINRIFFEWHFLDVGRVFESGLYSVGGSLESARDMSENGTSVEILTLTNVAVPRKILEDLSGFDERFKFTHHDGDFYIRALNKGYRVLFFPQPWVYHLTNPTGLTRSLYYRAKDQVRFTFSSVPLLKPGGVLKRWFHITIFVIFSLFYGLSKGSLVGFEALKGTIDGWREISRI